jgi:hypothetical protein
VIAVVRQYNRLSLATKKERAVAADFAKGYFSAIIGFSIADTWDFCFACGAAYLDMTR